MKRISTMLLTVVCFILAANLSMAKLDLRRKEPINIPPEMEAIKSPFELEAYLNHPKSRVREAAVMRLGQIGGSDAITVLLKFFENEPETTGVIDVPYGVKEAVVMALRQIGGKEAKEQIMNILSDTLEFGPTIEYYQEKTYTGQASHVIYLSLEALSDFPDDNVIRMLDEIAKDQSPPRDWFIAQTARKNLIKITLKRQGITKVEDKVNYLTKMLTGGGKGSGAFVGEGLKKIKTEEFVKNGAIEDVLMDLGSEALPYLKKSLSRIPENTDRGKAVKDVIEQIERISKYKSGELKVILL
jgi:hypothetical protein